MAKAVEDKAGETKPPLAKAERDVVALGIAVAAIILFVATGGTVMPQILRAWMGNGTGPDMLLTNAVLLNIALLIFGWRRYKELHKEVAERRRAEEKARLLAETDPLTQCLNRRSGTPAINGLLDQARAAGRSVAVFMIDLDNFKQINDLNGHQTGDRVLTAVAQRLREQMPAGSVLARMGGDEFVCAFGHESNGREGIEQFAARMIEQVGAPIDDGRVMVQPTISAGLVSTEQDPLTAPDIDAAILIHRADIAMYHAKKNGRNGYFWFEPMLEDELRLRNDLESAIRRGIPAGEFVPFYEQQIDLATGQLTGFEMLARWKSPRYGLVSPEVFIPIAEEIDLIADLSECLIRQALVDARDWDPDLTLSVNISPLQLRDAWFAQKLLHILVESGFPPSRLEIEITESCLHENIGAVRTIVSSLKNQGIKVCLDDFGTGYSSLSQLRSLPFDRLKIDRSFVAEMTREGANSDLVEAIISLGRGLALPVTAEGIETSEVLSTLRTMGGMKGQGYFYGMPEDADATRHRLAALDLLPSRHARPAPVLEGVPEVIPEDRIKAG
nr:EAL domain-containing protein [Altererythrobacter sp. KTW20L]